MTAHYGKQWKYLHYHHYIFPARQMRCLHFRSPVHSVSTFTLSKEKASTVKIMSNNPILIFCMSKGEKNVYSAFPSSCSNENLQVGLPLIKLWPRLQQLWSIYYIEYLAKHFSSLLNVERAKYIYVWIKQLEVRFSTRTAISK